MRKWTPTQVLEAFLVYRDLPLGERDKFFTNHTQDGDEIKFSHYLNCDCTTLGHPGAAPTTNFIRELYHTTISAAGALGQKYEEDLKDLADIDAHSYKMATSIHYDLSDFVDGPLVKKSIRSLYHLNNRMPVGFPEEHMTDEACAALKAGMGKMGDKEEAEAS